MKAARTPVRSACFYLLLLLTASLELYQVFGNIPRRNTLAWAPSLKIQPEKSLQSHKRSYSEWVPPKLSPAMMKEEPNDDDDLKKTSHMSSLLLSNHNPNRRFFLFATVGSVIGLTTKPSSQAIAANNYNSTSELGGSEVDWDSFGQQLQTLPSNLQINADIPAGTGGSDLEKALQDASKRKHIDPRSHG